MERKEDSTNILLETIRKEVDSIIEYGPESYESNYRRERQIKPEDTNDLGEVCSASSTDISLKNVLDNFNTTSIDDDLHKLQYKLDESYKLFQIIGELFESINFSYLKSRVKDLHLVERNIDSIKPIVDDLKDSFDGKYMENRLADLTKEVTSKFRNHNGEFGDIPEINEFFRACSKLEHGLDGLRKHRDDCTNLQKRMARLAEASYNRVNYIYKRVNSNGKNPQDV